MPDTLTLYSFSDADRSGKVRWVAEELGLEIIEQGVEFGAHRRPPYTDHNPLGQVPTARFRGQTLIESTAICHSLAEAVEAPRLWIGPGAPGRDLYLRHLAIFGETLEGRLVDCAISRIGLLPPGVFDVHAPHLKRRLPVLGASPTPRWPAPELARRGGAFEAGAGGPAAAVVRVNGGGGERRVLAVAAGQRRRRCAVGLPALHPPLVRVLVQRVVADVARNCKQLLQRLQHQAVDVEGEQGFPDAQNQQHQQDEANVEQRDHAGVFAQAEPQAHGEQGYPLAGRHDHPPEGPPGRARERRPVRYGTAVGVQCHGHVELAQL
jgi:hypothetical protein